MAADLKKNQMNLQRKLEAFLGSRNVYFQPPASMKLCYPCVVYSMERLNRQHADNAPYREAIGYSVTFITRDCDDNRAIQLGSFPYSYLDRFYVAGNLNHYVYTIFNQEED